MITGINTFKNFIVNGYPFIESIISHLPFCDKYYVNDGGSTDGTLEMLKRMERIFPKIRLFQMKDRENIRWNSASDQSNMMINEADTNWIFLGNGDELFHERDVYNIRQFVMDSRHWILRPTRREVRRDWSTLGLETYHPARFAKKISGLYMNWDPYGGDEFLFNDGWHDPDRLLLIPFVLYHLFNMFPENAMNKITKDALYIAPGDVMRVKNYEAMKGGSLKYRRPERVWRGLPALARGLAYMPKYEVRECLFDKDWLRKNTGLDY